MKSPNVLLATTLATGLVLSAATACGSGAENWAEQPEVSCREFKVDLAQEDLTVQSLAKAVRGCYDHVPDELRSYGESNSISVRIPTSDGKQVKFSVTSDAKIDSDINTYAEQAAVVSARNYPINTGPSNPNRIGTSSELQLNAEPGSLFARWSGQRDTADATRYHIYAGPSSRSDKPFVRIEPHVPTDIMTDGTDPRVIKCVQDDIKGQIDAAFGVASTPNTQPAVHMPPVTADCKLY